MSFRTQFLIAEKLIVKHVISSLLLTAALALILATPANAQVAKGLNEIGGKGSVESGKYSDEDDRSTVFDLSMFYGRNLTDRISVGPSLSYYKFGDEDSNGGLGAFANYHFTPSSKMVPFVEVAAGRFFGGADDQTYISIGPGAKMFLADGGGAIIAHAYYQRLMGDSVDTNELGLRIGVSVYFGR